MKLPVACRRPRWTSRAVVVAAVLSGSLFGPSPAPLGSMLAAAEPASSTTGPDRPVKDLPGSQSKKASLVENLSGPELEQAIESLKQHYFRPSELGPEELQRALLSGILARISPGAALIKVEDQAIGAEQPFRKETFKEIAYYRLGSLNRANLEALDAALKEGDAKRPAILDLRATPPSNDFELAAELLNRFCPAGKPGFKLKGPGPEKIQELGGAPTVSKQESRGLLVVLIDGENAGASEVIPAVLRLNAKAILIGEATKGEGLAFADFKVGRNAVLRVAISEVLLADGSKIDAQGVSPDLKVELSSEQKKKVLARELEEGVAPLVLETERPRMNEASLVAGTNPEMDAYQNAQKNGTDKATKQEAPLRDVVLQRAVDLITTISVYGKGRN